LTLNFFAAPFLSLASFFYYLLLDSLNSQLDQRGGGIDKKIADLDAQIKKQTEAMKKMKGPAKESAKRRALQLLKQKKM
jgi:hypothetical protein